ncbi:DNA-processing protein DprA [Mucilaginibacter sp. KACC 22063]|uniref:DNA-processing protein DprA n=1 Tax=Mucilaginibacter sp. KACC 22063 TaxID=3025666 RepID=UPI002366D565|nr:DNA-processing protein DprA [Mucilaginibacter sp. KACC 22063]WDF54109.1 DNA-processing protein DprA [Mucilaginibacter sp. KACC 22063]
MSLIHKIALSFIKNAGPVLAKSMLAYAGSAENVFSMVPKRLDRVPGIGPKRLEAFDFEAALKRAEEEIGFIEKHNIDVLFYSDPAYPKRLKACHDAPVLLYAKGKMDLNHPRIVSVIGTRQPTEYGKQLCRDLIEELSQYGVLVVSGLAHGIDVAAHKEALKHNMQTVGVLGHGLQQIYPAVNKGTAEKMLLNGGILTEYPSGVIPDRENFPSRNRIVAGIADATIVIEANIKSGTLITAEIANSYNRDVFAFPGRINDEFSEGCNFLIRNHKASLLTCAADVAYLMGWDKPDAAVAKPSQLSLAMDLSSEERQIMEILRSDAGIAIDELTLKVGMPVSQLTMNLLNLEMQGFIRSMPGKTYALN